MKIQRALTEATVLALLMSSMFILSQSAYLRGLQEGRTGGYQRALYDVSEITDLDFTWVQVDDGTYTLQVTCNGVSLALIAPKLDVHVEHWRGRTLISYERMAGSITNIGLDFIEAQISGSASTTNALYISCSADSGAGLSGSSTELVNELASNGFIRDTGAYANVGTGSWNVTVTFTATDTQAVQSYGLHWSATPESDNTMLGYDVSSVKNCVENDELRVTFQCSIENA